MIEQLNSVLLSGKITSFYFCYTAIFEIIVVYASQIFYINQRNSPEGTKQWKWSSVEGFHSCCQIVVSVRRCSLLEPMTASVSIASFVLLYRNV